MLVFGDGVQKKKDLGEQFTVRFTQYSVLSHKFFKGEFKKPRICIVLIKLSYDLIIISGRVGIGLSKKIILKIQ